uniref:Selenoprotein P N-terminal domain-containing protein n=3 Tax=Macaca TaxID=9539 RepID=A0A1D5QYU1_MACMU
ISEYAAVALWSCQSKAKSKEAGSLEGVVLEELRVKLEKEGYSNISYIVVNHQGISSRLKYTHLKNKVSEHIPVYQQEENQTDVWTLLNGSKDDFLIYDRLSKMKTFVKVYLWLLWMKQLKLHSPITIMSIITIRDISTLAAVSFQRISNQEHQMLLLILLLQAFITTISTRVNIGRVTQRAEICQEVKVYNIYKRSSDERDV